MCVLIICGYGRQAKECDIEVASQMCLLEVAWRLLWHVEAGRFKSSLLTLDR
jgi:hypothetical protein